MQLQQASDTSADKMMIISGTPGIGKSFCALYMASYWIAQGTRVIYELHDQDEAASVEWYHFPPNCGEGFCFAWQQDVRHYVKGATDGNTVYIVDGGLPRIASSSCWCYAFSSPQKSVYRYQRKVPSCHLVFLPLWTFPYGPWKSCHSVGAQWTFSAAKSQQSLRNLHLSLLAGSTHCTAASR